MASRAVKALMPTLAAGCLEIVKRSHGFTLLEILVVMAVVVVMLGVAVVNLDDSGERATLNEAEHLSIMLEAARDDATYSGKQLAFSTDGSGYQFWIGDDKQGKWRSLTDSSHLASGKLAHDVKIIAQYVNGKDQHLGERLVFAADGVSEPFELQLQGGKARAQITSDVLGRIDVARIANNNETR